MYSINFSFIVYSMCNDGKLYWRHGRRLDKSPIDIHVKSSGWGLIDQLNPATFLCLSKDRPWISICIYHDLFHVHVRGFVDIGVIVDNHFLNLLFMIVEKFCSEWNCNRIFHFMLRLRCDFLWEIRNYKTNVKYNGNIINITVKQVNTCLYKWK